jgi:hypothetical protein
VTTGEAAIVFGGIGLVGFVFFKARIMPIPPNGAPGSKTAFGATPPPPALNPQALAIYGATGIYNSFKNNPGGTLNAINPLNGNSKPVHPTSTGHGFFL